MGFAQHFVPYADAVWHTRCLKSFLLWLRPKCLRQGCETSCQTLEPLPSLPQALIYAQNPGFKGRNERLHLAHCSWHLQDVFVGDKSSWECREMELRVSFLYPPQHPTLPTASFTDPGLWWNPVQLLLFCVLAGRIRTCCHQ